MKFAKFFIIGIIFGFDLTKGEVVSWYRIQEMFRFESFHMYGVIGSAVIVGIVVIYVIKTSRLRSMQGEYIHFNPKDMTFPRYIIGGTIFGMGWALTGGCPGPMFILVGNGFLVFLVVIASAMLGTFVYGLMRDALPH